MAGIRGTMAAGLLLIAGLTGMSGLPAQEPAAAAESASTVPAQPAVQLRAADAEDFSPGRLISDERFYDDTAMDAEAVQAFLDSRRCRPVEGVECLGDYRQTTPDVPAVGPGHCSEYRGDEWEPASVIITGVARACGINPQVLLVMLQKEQSLLTSPSPSGYERAMGYACPDTADCDTEYFGFFNQVYNAAWQFRQYTLFPDDRPYVVGTVDIGFNPDAACGAAPVDIRNQATANLYNYTPYQPNAAALENLYGDGDGCSAYGNRNFWRIYTDWFGNPVETRYPDWFGPCLTNASGRPCVEEFWREPVER